jgi:hypothetical protein
MAPLCQIPESMSIHQHCCDHFASHTAYCVLYTFLQRTSTVMMCGSFLGSIQMASYLQYPDSSIYHFLPSLWTNTTIIPHTRFIPYCFYSLFIITQYYDISQYVYYNVHTA